LRSSQRFPYRGPRRPKINPRRSQISPYCTKLAKKSPKIAQESPQDRPRQPQDSTKFAQESSNITQESLQARPREPQEDPRKRQHSTNTNAKRVRRMLQKKSVCFVFLDLRVTSKEPNKTNRLPSCLETFRQMRQTISTNPPSSQERAREPTESADETIAHA
jgi:hypothetical protein